MFDAHQARIEARKAALKAFDVEHGGLESAVLHEGYYWFPDGASRSMNGDYCLGPDYSHGDTDQKGIELYHRHAVTAAEEAFRAIKEQCLHPFTKPRTAEGAKEAVQHLKELRQRVHNAVKAEQDYLYEHLIPRWGGSCGSEAYALMQSRVENNRIERQGKRLQRRERADQILRAVEDIEI